HACFVPNNWSAGERLDAYVRVLSDLVVDHARREQMGRDNRRLVEGGPFSINHRNRRLLATYASAIESYRVTQSRNRGDLLHEMARTHGLRIKHLPEDYLW